MFPPLRPHRSQGELGNQVGFASADRVAALFLFEEVGDDVAASSQPDLVALDLGNKAARNEMMMLLVPDAAVRADQLDTVFLDPVDCSEVDTVRTNHFHMLANILEAAHDRLL